MPRQVTRLVATELEPDADNPEPWCVEWAENVSGRDQPLTHRHDSKAAAQRHVKGLLAELATGLARECALTVVRLGE